MKNERVRQIVLAIIGLALLGVLYPLIDDLWQANWFVKNHGRDMEPMFLSFFVGVGIFLLLAARNPSRYRSFIIFAAVWNFLHSGVMAIETVQAWNHGVHRQFVDVLVAALVGVILLAVVPPRNDEGTQLYRRNTSSASSSGK